jgi:hypothetical protein
MKHLDKISSIIFLFTLSVLIVQCEDPAVDPATQVKSHTYSVGTWYWSSPHHYVNLDVPELTASNVQTAGVLVYYSSQPNVWTSVPYTVYGTLHDYHMGFRYAENLVEVTWMYDGASAGDDPNTYYSTTVKCKVVIVPSSARMANSDLDWNNFEEVQKRFDLRE